MSIINPPRVDLAYTLWYHDGTGFATRSVQDLDPAHYRRVFDGRVNAPCHDGMVNWPPTLELVFAQCNLGSGMESDHFLRQAIRSLSVGDVVQFGELAWMVEPFSWGTLTTVQFTALVKGAAR